MEENQIRRVPVVDAGDACIGIVAFSGCCQKRGEKRFGGSLAGSVGSQHFGFERRMNRFQIQDSGFGLKSEIYFIYISRR